MVKMVKMVKNYLFFLVFKINNHIPTLKVGGVISYQEN